MSPQTPHVPKSLTNLPDDLADGLRGLLSNTHKPMFQSDVLTDLLSATSARAVGVWRLADERLQLAAFLAVEDMPADVQQAFVQTTADVPLSQTQFGIVQAVVARGTVINHRAADASTTAAGSIGWLGRFVAASSLATPIFAQDRIVGAIAVAMPWRIEPHDAVWELVIAVARKL